MPAADESHEDDPRVRTARTQRDRARRALLDAADATFGSRGVARTRTEGIAQAAGARAATAHATSPPSTLRWPRPPAARPATDRPGTERHRGGAIDAGRPSTSTRSASAGRQIPGGTTTTRTLAPILGALRLLLTHGRASGELRRYPRHRR